MNLPALQNSPFLQSLGWAIANSIWQVAALWIGYHLVIGLYRGASAKFKNNLSTLLLSSSFIWFCITLFNKYFSIQNLSDNYIQVSGENNIVAATKYNWNNLLNNLNTVLPYLSVAYLLLLVFLSLRLINVYRYTRFIKFNGLQKPQAEWRIFTERVIRHLGITKNIKVWLSQHIDVPATIGFLKPVILIPLSSINQLSPDQLEAIILHELSHIKRNDYLINLFISIVETILFFNPFVLLLSRIIKRERENCCDDFVIQYQYDRHTYASALLSLEQCRNTNLRLAISATSGKKQLMHRIKRIMEVNSNSNFNYGQKLAALLFITGIIFSVAWLSPQNKKNNRYAKMIIPVEKQAKILNTNYKIKINTEANSDLVIPKQKENTIKIIPVKTLSKKVFTSTQGDVQVAQNFSLNELTEPEVNQRKNISKEGKEGRFHTFEKYSAAKLLNAKEAPNTTSFFNKDKATIFLKSVIANADINHQRTFFNFQKLQTELQKIHFSFSFDFDQMQNEIKHAVNQKQLNELMLLKQNIKEAEIENLIRIELKKWAIRSSSNLQTVKTQPRGSIVSNYGLLYIIDSLSHAEFKKIDTHRRQNETRVNTIYPGRYNSAAGPWPQAHAYSYDDDFPSNTENANKKSSVKIFNKPNGVSRTSTLGVSIKNGFSFRAIPKVENASKTYSPKPATQTQKG